MHQGPQTQYWGPPCIRVRRRQGPQTQHRGASCLGVPRASGTPEPSSGDPLLTFLPGARGVLSAVLFVVLAAGAGAAQGGQEQEGDPQRGAAHLQQVRGCGTAGGGSVPARPAART